MAGLLGSSVVAVLHSQECHTFACQLEGNLLMCLKNYTYVPCLNELSEVTSSEVTTKPNAAKNVEFAVLLISRQLLRDNSQLTFELETILRNNTPQYVIWLDNNKDDFREFGTLVSRQYPTLEAPARKVQLSSDEEAEGIAQDILTVICKNTDDLRMACYKALEDTQQFLADNMDLHYVLKRLEQDNQLTPDDVLFIKEEPNQVARGNRLIHELRESMRQDSYDFLVCILKEAGQDFLAAEIEDCERKQEEFITGGQAIPPDQASEQTHQSGTELLVTQTSTAIQKVVLLGETGAGKSDLVLSITKGEAQVDSKASGTIGVDLTSYHDTKHGVMYQLYDFGGQEIYHLTHQFLFTPQTLYLLNVDLPGYNSEKFQKCLGTWLTSVTGRVINPAITVIGNKIDLLPTREMTESLCNQIKKDVKAAERAMLDKLVAELQSCEDALKAPDNESDVSEDFHGLTKEDIIAKKMSIQKLIEGRPRCLVNVQVLPVSSKTLEGVEDLCTKMAEMTHILSAEQGLRHSWISFKDKIRRGKEPHLHMNDCQKIGAAAGMKDSDVRDALSYLHVTGQILYYKDIKGMENVIFPDPTIILTLFKQIFGKDKTEHLHKYSLGMTEGKANSLLKVLLEDKTETFTKLLPLLKHFGLYHSGLFSPVFLTTKSEEKPQSDPTKPRPGYGSISISMEHCQDPPVGFLEAIVSRLLSIPQTMYTLLRKDAGWLNYLCKTFEDEKMYHGKLRTVRMFEARIETMLISYLSTPKANRIQVHGKFEIAFGLVKEIGEALLQVCQDVFPMLYTKGSIKYEGAIKSLPLEAASRYRATELMKLSQGQFLEYREHDIHKHYLDNQLYETSKDLGNEWNRLGRELGLQQGMLGKIRDNYRSSEQCTQQAFQVLKLWYSKSNKGPLQFLPQLEEALNAMGKYSQADDIGYLIEKYQEETVVNPEETDVMQWSVHLTGNEGIYLCPRTNLGVVTPCTLHVSYWCENWSGHEWRKEDEKRWKPVGPMFSIKCEDVDGPVDILLPHVLHISKEEASAINTEDVKVVHIVEGTAELLCSTEVTTTHVITRFKKGSVFGPIMKWGAQHSINGMCVVFAPEKLTSNFQLRVYMMSNAVHIVEYLTTIEEKDGYKKWDQEPCVLETGKDYYINVRVLEEECNVQPYPKEGLIFNNTFEMGKYYKKFRVEVSASRPRVTVEICLKDANNATVCIFPTKAPDIAPDEERADSSRCAGFPEEDVNTAHVQTLHPQAPEPTLPSDRQSTVLLMIDEYGSFKCESSTINYQLACMLIDAGVKVYSIALREPVSEATSGVKLLLPKREEGDSREPSLEWLTFDHRSRYPDLPKDITHIVGHVDVTSRAANEFKEHRLPDVKVILFHHEIPEDTECYKDDEKAMGIGQKKESICKDAKKADILFSVGPIIYDYYENEHRAIRSSTLRHHLFLPEPPSIFRNTQVTYVETQRKIVLSIGPVKGVGKLKGYDLIASAMIIVIKTDPYITWQVRNICKDDLQLTKQEMKAHMDSGSFNFTPLPYGTEQEICKDLQKAHLVLMPSRAEPFGLVGLEAIAAGVPVLISSKSGLAEFVRVHAPRFRHRIIEISDSKTDVATAQQLAKRITDSLRNSKAEFQEAGDFKKHLLESEYWKESQQHFLQACGVSGPAPLEEVSTTS
ncbi:uncharacterized protein LOC144863611 [Branchiostoma floridae x Branchiostoma japonicum]